MSSDSHAAATLFFTLSLTQKLRQTVKTVTHTDIHTCTHTQTQTHTLTQTHTNLSSTPHLLRLKPKAIYSMYQTQEKESFHTRIHSQKFQPSHCTAVSHFFMVSAVASACVIFPDCAYWISWKRSDMRLTDFMNFSRHVTAHVFCQPRKSIKHINNML